MTQYVVSLLLLAPSLFLTRKYSATYIAVLPVHLILEKSLILLKTSLHIDFWHICGIGYSTEYFFKNAYIWNISLYIQCLTWNIYIYIYIYIYIHPHRKSNSFLSRNPPKKYGIFSRHPLLFFFKMPFNSQPLNREKRGGFPLSSSRIFSKVAGLGPLPRMFSWGFSVFLLNQPFTSIYESTIDTSLGNTLWDFPMQRQPVSHYLHNSSTTQSCFSIATFK